MAFSRILPILPVPSKCAGKLGVGPKQEFPEDIPTVRPYVCTSTHVLDTRSFRIPEHCYPSSALATMIYFSVYQIFSINMRLDIYWPFELRSLYFHSSIVTSRGWDYVYVHSFLYLVVLPIFVSNVVQITWLFFAPVCNSITAKVLL